MSTIIYGKRKTGKSSLIKDIVAPYKDMNKLNMIFKKEIQNVLLSDTVIYPVLINIILEYYYVENIWEKCVCAGFNISSSLSSRINFPIIADQYRDKNIKLTFDTKFLEELNDYQKNKFID